MPREKQYNPQEMLDRAARTFWARGYEGTSVADLVAATGLNRGSLYSAYDGKQALFAEALVHYDKKYRQEHLDRLRKIHDPRGAILSAFEDAAAGTGTEHTPPGCLLVNSALERAPHDPEVAALVQKSFDAVEVFFRDGIREAQDAGTIPVSVEATAIAKSLLGLFLGLRVLARSGAPQESRDAIIKQAEALLM